MSTTTSALERHPWPIRIAAVIGGTAAIAVSAQISVPFHPVPMTLQTLIILVIGLTYGSRLGAATLAVYLLEGAAGLPVFAGGASAMAFVGPTTGFLLGFVAMAWIAGLAAGRGLVAMGTATLAASAVLYAFGLAWPFALAGMTGIDAAWAGMAPGPLLAAFAMPFLAGDLVKAALAAMIVAGGTTALRRR